MKTPLTESTAPASSVTSTTPTPDGGMCGIGRSQLKFGLQWKTMQGKRAFLWTVMQGCHGPMAHGVIYDEKTQTWGGRIDSDHEWVLQNLIEGVPPNLKNLERACARELRWRFEMLS